MNNSASNYSSGGVGGDQVRSVNSRSTPVQFEDDIQRENQRLSVIASYSPKSVYLPVLLDRLKPNDPQRFQRTRRSFFGVTVLSDISGFTRLAEMLAKGLHPSQQHGNESNTDNTDNTEKSDNHEMKKGLQQRRGANILAKVINKIFSMLIEIIHKYNGDVIAFAGDALLSVWRPSPKYDDETICVHAARAVWEMQEAMKEFSTDGVVLTLHTGLSAGMLKEFNFGGFRDRWEYVVAGQPIYEMGHAVDHAKSGECVVHSTMWSILQERGCVGDVVDDDGRFVRLSHVPEQNVVRIDVATILASTMHATTRQNATTALAGYVPKPVLSSLNAGKYSLVSELRRVTILFVNLPDFQYDTQEQTDANQEAFCKIQDALSRYDGNLRQLIQDDKGTVVIAAFGLPYCSHDDDSLRGVLAAVAIKTALNNVGMRTGIGVTTGDAYCGSVGNTQRCEYAIVGDCVNLSARLMCKSNGGILCDKDTFSNVVKNRKSLNTLNFENKGSIAVKGQSMPVKIFRPYLVETECEQHTYKVPLLGRAHEMQVIQQALLNRRTNGKHMYVVISASEGMGKTRMLNMAMALNREMCIPYLYTLVNSMNQSFMLSVWKDIVRTIINELYASREESETASPVSLLRKASVVIEHLAHMPDRALATLQMFFGDDGDEQVNGAANDDGTLPNHNRDVGVVRELILQFIRAYSQLHPGVVLYFDNFHWLDADSWQIVRELMQNVQQYNVGIIVTTLPEQTNICEELAKPTLSVTIEPMSMKLVRSLCTSMLNVCDIPENLLDAVMAMSGGQPSLVEELIRSMVSVKTDAKMPDSNELPYYHEMYDQIEDITVTPLMQQILLSRIDKMSPYENEILKVASVIGLEFPVWLVKKVCPEEYSGEIIDAGIESLSKQMMIQLSGSSDSQIGHFRHIFIQDMAHKVLSEQERHRLHGIVATELEKHHQTTYTTLDVTETKDVYSTSIQIGRHFEIAGKSLRALHYYQVASVAAIRWGMHDAANEVLRHAIDLADHDCVSRDGGGDGSNQIIIDDMRFSRWHGALAKVHCYQFQMDAALKELTIACERLGFRLDAASDFQNIHSDRQQFDALCELFDLCDPHDKTIGLRRKVQLQAMYSSRMLDNSSPKLISGVSCRMAQFIESASRAVLNELIALLAHVCYCAVETSQLPMLAYASLASLMVAKALGRPLETAFANAAVSVTFLQMEYLDKCKHFYQLATSEYQEVDDAGITEHDPTLTLRTQYMLTIVDFTVCRWGSARHHVQRDYQLLTQRADRYGIVRSVCMVALMDRLNGQVEHSTVAVHRIKLCQAEFSTHEISDEVLAIFNENMLVCGNFQQMENNLLNVDESLLYQTDVREKMRLATQLRMCASWVAAVWRNKAVMFQCGTSKDTSFIALPYKLVCDRQDIQRKFKWLGILNMLEHCLNLMNSTMKSFEFVDAYSSVAEVALGMLAFSAHEHTLMPLREHIETLCTSIVDFLRQASQSMLICAPLFEMWCGVWNILKGSINDGINKLCSVVTSSKSLQLPYFQMLAHSFLAKVTVSMVSSDHVTKPKKKLKNGSGWSLLKKTTFTPNDLDSYGKVGSSTWRRHHLDTAVQLARQSKHIYIEAILTQNEEFSMPVWVYCGRPMSRNGTSRRFSKASALRRTFRSKISSFQWRPFDDHHMTKVNRRGSIASSAQVASGQVIDMLDDIVYDEATNCSTVQQPQTPTSSQRCLKLVKIVTESDDIVRGLAINVIDMDECDESRVYERQDSVSAVETTLHAYASGIMYSTSVTDSVGMDGHGVQRISLVNNERQHQLLTYWHKSTCQKAHHSRNSSSAKPSATNTTQNENMSLQMMSIDLLPKRLLLQVLQQPQGKSSVPGILHRQEHVLLGVAVRPVVNFKWSDVGMWTLYSDLCESVVSSIADYDGQLLQLNNMQCIAYWSKDTVNDLDAAIEQATRCVDNIEARTKHSASCQYFQLNFALTCGEMVACQTQGVRRSFLSYALIGEPLDVLRNALSTTSESAEYKLFMCTSVKNALKTRSSSLSSSSRAHSTISSNGTIRKRELEITTYVPARNSDFINSVSFFVNTSEVYDTLNLYVPWVTDNSLEGRVDTVNFGSVSSQTAASMQRTMVWARIRVASYSRMEEQFQNIMDSLLLFSYVYPAEPMRVTHGSVTVDAQFVCCDAQSAVNIATKLYAVVSSICDTVCSIGVGSGFILVSRFRNTISNHWDIMGPGVSVCERMLNMACNNTTHGHAVADTTNRAKSGRIVLDESVYMEVKSGVVAVEVTVEKDYGSIIRCFQLVRVKCELLDGMKVPIIHMDRIHTLEQHLPVPTQENDSQGLLVMVDGRSGTGKTTLLEHMCKSVLVGNKCVLLTAYASSIDKDVPFNALRPIFRQLFDHNDQLHVPLSVVELSNRFRVVYPELVVYCSLLNSFLPYRFSQSDYSSHLSREAQTIVLRRVIVAFLHLVLAKTPTLICVHHGDHLDEDSWQVIATLVHDCPTCTVMVSCQPLSSNSWLLKQLPDDIQYVAMSVGKLEESQTHTLSMLCLGVTHIEPTFVQFVQEKTNGHLRDVVDVSHTLVECNSDLFPMITGSSKPRQHNAHTVDDDAQTSLSALLPQHLSDVSLMRLELLTSAEKVVLQLIAVANIQCDLKTIVYTHPELDKWECWSGGSDLHHNPHYQAHIDSLFSMVGKQTKRLVELKILRESNSCFSLASTSLRDMVLSRTSAFVEQKIHHRLAVYIEQSSENKDNLLIARHFQASQNLSKQFYYTIMAARSEAVDREALFQRGVTLYHQLHQEMQFRSAIVHGQIHKSDVQSQDIDNLLQLFSIDRIFLDMARAQLEIGVYNRANQTLEQVFQMIGFSVPTVENERQYVDQVRICTGNLNKWPHIPLSLHCSDMEVLHENSQKVVSALLDFASSNYFLREYPSVVYSCVLGIQICNEFALNDKLMQLECFLAMACAPLSLSIAALKECRQRLENATNDDATQCDMMYCNGNLAAVNGEWNAGLAHFSKVSATNPYVHMKASLAKAYIHVIMGNLKSAEKQCQSTVEALIDWPNHHVGNEASILMVYITLQQDRTKEATRNLKQARSFEQLYDDSSLIGRTLEAHIQFRVGASSMDSVFTKVEEISEDWRQQCSTSFSPWMAFLYPLCMGNLCTELLANVNPTDTDASDTCSLILSQLQAVIDHIGHLCEIYEWLTPLHLQFRGIVAYASGERGNAREMWHDAVRAFNDNHMMIMAARCLFFCGYLVSETEMDSRINIVAAYRSFLQQGMAFETKVCREALYTMPIHDLAPQVRSVVLGPFPAWNNNFIRFVREHSKRANLDDKFLSPVRLKVVKEQERDDGNWMRYMRARNIKNRFSKKLKSIRSRKSRLSGQRTPASSPAAARGM